MRQHRLNILLFIIRVAGIMLLPTSLLAQDPYVIKINRSLGLPSDVVYDIIEDKEGFFWISTGDGLVRYDGQFIKPVLAPAGGTRSGSHLKVDPQGRLWFENFDGNIYYKEGGKLIQHNSGLPFGFLDYHILNGKLMYHTKDSIFIVDTRTLKKEKSISMPGKDVFYLIGDDDGLHIFSYEHYTVSSNGEIKKHKLLEDFRINTPIVGTIADGKLWYINKSNTQQNISYTDFKNTFRGFQTKELSFIQNLFYIDKSFWFCCSDGLFIYNEEGKLLNNAPFFKGISISSVMKDSRGNYWVGTLTDGVFVVKNFDRLFISTGEYKPSKLAAFHDQLIIGTKNGELLALDGPNPTSPFFESKGNHSIYYLEADNKNGQLVATSSSFDMFDKGLYKYYTHKGAIKDVDRVDDKYTAFAGSGASGLLLTGDSKLKSEWDSIFIKHTFFSVADGSSIIPGRGKSVCLDRKRNKLFFATNQGFFELNPSELRKMEIAELNGSIQKVELIGDTLFALNTEGKLLLFSLTDEGLRKEDESIPHHWRWFKKDERFVYLLSDDRVSYIDLKKKPWVVVDIKGLNQNDKINDIIFHQSQFYVASENGLIIIPEKESIPNQSPRLKIDELRIGGAHSSEFDLSFLKYDQNNVSLYFSVASYPGEELVPVYFSLDNRTWTELRARAQSLDLPALKPGYYTVYLKAGENGEVISSPSFIIRKPFWESYGFIFSIVLILGLAVFFYYRYQTGLLKRQNKLLLEKVSLEKDLQLAMMRSIKSQMNPHFFYNALNTIQSFIFNDDKRNAGIYLSKFSQLTRRILEMSEREYVLISEEIEVIKLYLEIEMVRFNNEMTFVIQVDDNIDQDLIKIPGMLIQPYVENAIKHGLLHKKGPKSLKIHFYKQNDFLKIDIIDNGIGRERSAELNAIKNRGHQSFATHANSKRLELLNRAHGTVGVEFIDLRDDMGFATGTAVKITIPINT